MTTRARFSGAFLLLAITVLSSSTLAQDQAAPQHRGGPDRDLWYALKKALTGSDGLKYFEANLKDVVLPTLVGKVIAATPEDHPSVLVLSMYDDDQPEVTLRLTKTAGHRQVEDHMPGPVRPGSRITFEGIGESFTQEPFMLTFEVPTDRRH